MLQKGLAPIVIVLTIAILLGIYLVIDRLMFYTTQSPPIQQTSQPSVIPTQKPIDHVQVESSKDVSGWLTAVNTENGFSFSFPADWGYCIYGGITLAGEKSDIRPQTPCYVNTGAILKSTNIAKADFPIPVGMTEKEALKLEEGRGVSPLVSEEYLNINGVPAYRALRSLQEHYDGTPLDPIITSLEYTYLKDDQLYRLWFQINSNDSDEYISTMDQIARTVKISQ